MAVTPKAVKRRDGTLRWRVQFREAPGATPTTETFSSPDAAQRFIDVGTQLGWGEARRIRTGMADTTGKTPTLAAWLDTHLDELASSATPGTVHDYRLDAQRTWLPKLGRLPLDMITRERVIEWVAWQRRQETARSVKRRKRIDDDNRDRPASERIPLPPAELVSDKTIANAHGLLSSVLASAGQRYDLRNPAEGVRLPSDQEREEMVFLTAAEFEKLLLEIPEYWQPFVAFLAETGTRWGEATALTAADFDLDSDTPSVRITRAWKRGERGGRYLGAPKTRRGRRTVALSVTTVAIIRGVVESTAPGQLVFRGARGGRVASQNFHPRVWRRAIEAAKLGKQPRVHDLRHSHASWLIAAGVPLPVIQYRLGHESIKTTVDRYGHLLPGAGDIAAQAIESIRGGTAVPLTPELEA